MLRKTLYILALFIFITSCADRANKPGSTNQGNINAQKQDSTITDSFSYKNEQGYLRRKRAICDRLALYDIEKGTDSLEMRMWFIPSMGDQNTLYILKVTNARWTLFHYQIYMHRATSDDHYYNDPVIEYFNNPLVDSVVMKSVSPQKTDWKAYINSLQLDSLWDLQTESSIRGMPVVVADGNSYILELNRKGKYKYLFYTTLENLQANNNNLKRFMEFKKRLLDQIIY